MAKLPAMKIGVTFTQCSKCDREIVIRCMDCTNWKEQAYEGFPVGKGYCKENMMDTDGYFYCGYAERRVNDGEKAD